MADIAAEKIYGVLSREREVESYKYLLKGLRAKHKNSQLKDSIIGFDTNVLLRLAGHKMYPTIVDFLSVERNGKVVIPGQSIQEFWSNIYSIKKQDKHKVIKELDNLESKIKSLGPAFDDSFLSYSAVASQIKNDLNNYHNKNISKKFIEFFESLSEKAVVDYAPRDLFHQIAQNRAHNKTPPGYMDNSHSDFYVWLDFLYSSFNLVSKHDIEAAYFITNEQKEDWLCEGTLHPVLQAEYHAICDIDIRCLSLDMFAQLISDAEI